MKTTLIGIAAAAALLALGSAQAQILRGGGEAGDYMRSHPDTQRERGDASRDREATQSLHERDKDAADEARENASKGSSSDLRSANKDLRDGAGLNNPADMERGKRPDARDGGR